MLLTIWALLSRTFDFSETQIDNYNITRTLFVLRGCPGVQWLCTRTPPTSSTPTSPPPSRPRVGCIREQYCGSGLWFLGPRIRTRNVIFRISRSIFVFIMKIWSNIADLFDINICKIVYSLLCSKILDNKLKYDIIIAFVHSVLISFPLGTCTYYINKDEPDICVVRYIFFLFVGSNISLMKPIVMSWVTVYFVLLLINK